MSMRPLFNDFGDADRFRFLHPTLGQRLLALFAARRVPLGLLAALAVVLVICGSGVAA